MKKLVLFLLLFPSLIIKTEAQTSVYHPLPDSNAYWNESFAFADGMGTYGEYDYSLFINGDSTVEGVTYKKFYRSGTGHGYPGPPIAYHDELVALIRQEPLNKKIFVLNGSTDEVLYDFNLSVGDTLPQTYNNKYNVNIVTAIDSVLMGSDYRKQFWIESNPQISIIEGMGSTYGLLAKFDVPLMDGYQLYCFVVDGQTLYGSSPCDFMTSTKDQPFDEFISISPNPATNQLTIHTSSFNKDEHPTVYIMNVMGQNTSPPASRNSAGLSSGEPLHMERGEASIDVSKLPSGIYFLQIRTEKGSFTNKFIKQ